MIEPSGRATLLDAVAAAAGALWQALVLLVAMVIAVQPPAADGPATGLALLPLVVCYRIGQRTPMALACPLAAACGAGLDVLAHGPIGYWAVIAAAAAALGAHARQLERADVHARWAVFGAHLMALALLQGSLVLACTFAAPAWSVIIRQSVVAALVYPLVAWMLPLPKLVSRGLAAARLARS